MLRQKEVTCGRQEVLNNGKVRVKGLKGIQRWSTGGEGVRSEGKQDQWDGKHGRRAGKYGGKATKYG